MKQTPFISVIVPVHNGARYLDSCLEALLASSYPAYEVVVIDDASTDDSGRISRAKGATVLRLCERSGPAAARNRGAREARGRILFFVDADVVVSPATLERIAAIFSAFPRVDAVFGSYDDAPAAQNLISQYKNLQHHFIHQQANPEARTFWAGCGAVRREAFEAVGGFDAQRFGEPSIEDIELGLRLSEAGFRILLDKSLQAKHLKRWTLKTLLHADIFRRAVPWSRLILETGRMTNDLNLRRSHRVSAALAGLLLALAPLCFLFPRLLYAAALLLVALVLLNRELYAFFLRRRGLVFAASAFPLHVLYYIYSGLAFVLCRVEHWARRRTVRREARAQ